LPVLTFSPYEDAVRAANVASISSVLPRTGSAVVPFGTVRFLM
jgi:hypothetical protein